MNSENRSEIKVSVVGAGYWGKNLVRNFNELGALEVICDGDEGRRRDFAEKYPDCRICDDFEAILRDDGIRGVVIATPAETHAALVKAALLADKDVFVEKPLCLTVEDGRELVDLAAARDRILMVGHILWYHPAIVRLKELVAGGELGKINYIYSNRLNLGKIRREENILWSFAPHDISVILGLLEEMPSEVESRGGYYLQKEVADVTVSLLSFPSGVKAHVFVSWLHPFKEQKLVVVGERKMAVFDDVEPKNKLRLYHHSVDLNGDVPLVNKADAEPVALGMEEPLRAECSHFLDCVRERKEPRTSGKEGLSVLKVLHQCEKGL